MTYHLILQDGDEQRRWRFQRLPHALPGLDRLLAGLPPDDSARHQGANPLLGRRAGLTLYRQGDESPGTMTSLLCSAYDLPLGQGRAAPGHDYAALADARRERDDPDGWLGGLTRLPIDECSPRAMLWYIGEALYGLDWRRPLAVALDINPRTIARWALGESPVPGGAMADLSVVLQAEARRAEDRARNLRALASGAYSA